MLPATIAGVRLDRWLVSRLTPTYGTWLLRLLGVAGLATVAFAIVPPFLDEYRAMHGTRGVMQVGHCSARPGRSSTTWTCHGSFAGDDGTRIANVTVSVRRDTAPASPYVVLVASATAARAYPPGGQGYVDRALLGGTVVAAACLCLYWSFGGRRWGGAATAGFRQPARLSRRA